jgi:ferredoxin
MLKGNGEGIYRRLGSKIDGLTVRVPWNEKIHHILKELYSPEEADVVVNMPYGLASVDRISRVTGIEEARLQTILERLANKGLLMDLWNDNENRYYYSPSPLVVGIFEFTMMRTRGELNMKEWARLFHEYMEAPFYAANAAHGEHITPLRVIPIEDTIKPGTFIEFLDYEKASAIIDNASKFGIGLCSCRNEKAQLGEKKCEAPVESCTLFDIGAEYCIRHGMGREASKAEIQDHFARSKELGLVMSAGNTKKNPVSVCHCCKCCCNYLAGLRTFGFKDFVVTSTFISKADNTKCSGCGKCVEVCPVNATSLVSADSIEDRKKKRSQVNQNICVGCGVCAFNCPKGALTMVKRSRQVIHPESFFEQTILQCLERGTLQNQMFDEPHNLAHKALRPFMGAFLKLPPVKRTLMSDELRSSFLNFMKKGVESQGKGWIVNL